MNDLTVDRDVDGLGLLDDAGHIGLFDFAVFERDHAAAAEALDVASGDARVDVGDFSASHGFGLIDGALNRLNRRLDVDDDALSQPLRRVRADADDVDAVFSQLTDDCADLRRADVEADENLSTSGLCHVSLVPSRFRGECYFAERLLFSEGALGVG